MRFFYYHELMVFSHVSRSRLMEIIKVERLDHLGLVAGVIKQLNLVEIIDKRLGIEADEKISTGEAVAGMILNGLGFANRPLTLMPEFFENKSLDLFFRPEVEAEHFNRFKLGRALDKVHAYGADLLFSELATLGCQAEGIDLRFRSLDTTTFSLTGQYLPESDGDGKGRERPVSPIEAITIRHGYSKDHRPDLKQAVLELMVSQDGGIPLVSKAWDGNSSDNTVFKQRAKALVETLQSSPTPSYLVADSKLYSQDSATVLKQIGFITRIPATISLVRTSIQAAIELADAWQHLLPQYRYQCLAHVHYGIKQRWLIIYSEAARNRAKLRNEKAIDKERNRIKKHLFHLQAQRFDSQEQALKALHVIENKLRYHRLRDRHWKAHRRYAESGRPGKDTPIKAIQWQIQAQFQVDVSAVEARIEQEACFIIATNADQLSDEQVFSAYKGQSAVEHGFRFLKDPLFFVSSLFVKKPSRIQGLLMVMTLALFVYSMAQRHLRRKLAQTDQQVPNQIKVPTSRPTLRWVFQLLDGINRIVVRTNAGQDTIIEGLTELKIKILRLFDPCVQQIYQIPST